MGTERGNDEKEKFLQEQLKLLKLKVQEKRLNDVWAQFTGAGFRPLLIKGWATAVFYPNPADRLYVDFDLVFDAAEFIAAQEFARGREMGFLIDFHRGARHLDSLGFEELYARSVVKTCGAGEVRVPCDEDHLRIISVHWLNDGGADREKLWDIYHAVNNRRADFDWSKCLDVVPPKRRFWVVCAIGIAHRYLHLDLSGIDFQDEFAKIPGWVYRTVEREWASDVRLVPLHQQLGNRNELWKQIKKRIPPNAIQATIEVNGAIDRTPRLIYQIADIFKRIAPSWARIRGGLRLGKRR
jgi:hypothetical protein